MLENTKLENVLFIDIETVPQYSDYESLPIIYQKLWEKKSIFFRKENESASDVYQRAGIYAEFGKIICISAGIINFIKNSKSFRIKSFYGDDELKLLKEFCDMLNKYSIKKEIFLCAHNGKEFDFPYLVRRMLINGIKLPKIIDVAGKKPWEVPFIDTLELWKFGDYKHYTSLELLAHLFEISSPKDDIDGSMVAEIFYKENNIKRIVEYCEKDVLTVAQLLLRYKGEELIKSENIDIVSD